MTTQPAIYIPHGGGPWPFMDDPRGMWTDLGAWLADLPTALPARPDAIVIVTAHWEATDFTAASGPSPGLIYDYYGFPDHTYDVTYPAPGAPEVAERLASLVRDEGMTLTLDPDYGWDHGVFVPLAVTHPDAGVPVVAVSLEAGLDPSRHVAFGAAIAPIRDDNVLVIGSGMSTHDLTMRVTVDESNAFDHWLEEVMTGPPTDRGRRLADWASAPGGRANHPREEHLLPAMVVAGAGRDSTGERVYRGRFIDHPLGGYRFD